MRCRREERGKNEDQVGRMEEWIIPVGQKSRAQQELRSRDELVFVVIQLARHRAHEKQEQNRTKSSDYDSHPTPSVYDKTWADFD